MNIINNKKQLKEIIGEPYVLCNDYGFENLANPSVLSFDLVRRMYSYDCLGKAYEKLGFSFNTYDVSKYVILYKGQIYFNLTYEADFHYKKYGLKIEGKDFVPNLSLGSLIKLLVYSQKQASIINLIEDYKKEFEIKYNQLKNIDWQFDFSDTNDLKTELSQELQLFLNEYQETFQLSIILSIMQKYFKIDTNQLNFDNTDLVLKDNYLKSIQLLNKMLSGNYELDKFLGEFGYRSFKEFELSVEVFAEQKELFQKMINRKQQKTVSIEELNNDKDINIQNYKIFLILRNNFRLIALKRIYRIRKIILKVFNNNLKNDAFYLTFDEIFYEKELGKLKLLIKDRMDLLAEVRNIDYEVLVTSEEIEKEYKPLQAKESKILVVSSGKVKGLVYVIKNVYDINIPSNSILLLPSAGAEYSHLYSKAIGLIFLKGGILSHGSIVARELKIPAVIANLDIEVVYGKMVTIDTVNSKLIIHK